MRRDVGGWLKTDLRLYVGGRDRFQAVEGMARQVAAVTQALDDTDFPVIPALCFVEANWGLISKAFKVQGVWVTWAECLADLILEPGPLDRAAVERAATTLASRLPAK